MTEVDRDSEAVAGFTTGRVEAFSDGVIAIAITLLVLDLHSEHRPGESLGHALTTGHAWSSYAAYVVSFAVIGITWVNHHSLFARIALMGRSLLFLNLGLLLGLSVLPFPTRVLAENLTAGGSDAHVAAFLYSAVMLYVSIMFLAVWWWATQPGTQRLVTPLPPDGIRRSRRRFGLGLVIYSAALVLSFVSAPLTLALHGVIAIYYAFEQLRSE
ncbi:MAG: DUF1211 domain-containing protein [Frankiales bacterium]|nr:DUF1211 domain-containing protein [Frankiales bacterium]